MELKDVDTTGYLYDPKDKESYQRLLKFKEFQEDIPINKDKVLQYIILMYDMSNDDVRTEYPYYPQRKRELCRLVKLTRGEKMGEDLENMLIGLIPEVNAMIVRYLSLFNNPELIMLSAYWEIFIELNKRQFSGQFDKNQVDYIKKINEDINHLTERLFRGKDETELRAELYKSLKDQTLGIKPEEIAEKISKGEDPLGDYTPYGDGYEVSPMKFQGDA